MTLRSSLPPLLFLLGFAACSSATPEPGDDDDDSSPYQTVFCHSGVAYDYSPGAFDRLTTFPDDLWSVADPSTVTGRRLAFSSDLPGVQALSSDRFDAMFDSLSTLDGFGTLASITLRFTGGVDLATVPSGEVTAEAGLPVALLCADEEGAFTRFPFEVSSTDEGATLLLAPMIPLPAASTCLAAVSTAVEAEAQCISPSETLKTLLRGDLPGTSFEGLPERYQTAVDALIADGAITGIGDVSALTVFTTQSITEESETIAEDVMTLSPVPDGPFTCWDDLLYRVCDGSFTAVDYRSGSLSIDLSQGIDRSVTWSIPIRVWLPLKGEGPFPVALFGHGLGGSRGQGDELARVAAPEGVATIAIDSLEHGDHPGNHESDELFQILSFFGILLDDLSLDPLWLRDNFRQSTYDKLQVLQMIRGGMDLNGDGTTDLDPQRMVYVGASLGGIMGPELLALAPDMPVGVLIVPGGRVSSIIEESETFAPLIALMRPEGTSDGDVDRFFPILQTLLERGDSANYGPHVLTNRLPVAQGGAVPQVVFGMVMNDEVVPNPSNRALARSMGIPHLDPVLEEIGIIPLGGPAPLSGNLPDGGTAGLLQFDRVLEEDGSIGVAAHDNLPSNVVGTTCWVHFMNSWLENGVAEIINPYEELGIDP